MRKLITIIASCALLVCQAYASQNNRSTEKRIDAIISGMTLEEKAHMLVGLWESGVPSNIISSAGRTHPLERFGIIPATMNDGATGLRMDTLRTGYPDERYYCTGFPVATMVASTWNDEIARKVGARIADEMLAYGSDLLLGPSLNIQRNPLCGRNFEYYSEDPYLSGHTAAQFIIGLQSKGPGATVKHFAANNQQSARVNNDARISQRALREIYLRNFEIAIKEGDPIAVMSSYNYINGTRTCASPELLTGILRKEWGWNGVVMTDWFQPEVTADCVRAGNDLMMGGCQAQVDDIIRAAEDGTLTMDVIDRNVRNVLRFVLQTPGQNGLVPNYEAHLELGAPVALEAAEEGIVLLKNDASVLPLGSDETVAVFGIGSYLFYPNGLGCADINKPYTINLLEGMKREGIKINQTVDRYYNKFIEAEQVQLYETNTKTWKNWFFGYKMPQEAILRPFFIEKRAADCDKAIITIARNIGEALDRDYVEGEYLLSPQERDMISVVCDIFHKAGKKVIIVVNTGSPIELGRECIEKADAILLAWQPGQEGGRAVARVLNGKVNPSGKLPVTWASDYYDIPSSKNFPIHYVFNWDDVKPFGRESLKQTRNLGYTIYEEDIWVGYRYFDTFGKAVDFPFGFGLSYTSFEWSDARLEKKGRDAVKISICVKNVGDRPGKDVVQIYSTAPRIEGFETPAHELRAYGKTPLLQPGESVKMEWTIAYDDLASFHEDTMSWITQAGEHILSFGASSAEMKDSLSFTLSRERVRKVSNKL